MLKIEDYAFSFGLCFSRQIMLKIMLAYCINAYGGGGAQSATPRKNPVPRLRIYSSKIFLKACPKLSLVKQTWFPWKPWLWF